MHQHSEFLAPLWHNFLSQDASTGSCRKTYVHPQLKEQTTHRVPSLFEIRHELSGIKPRLQFLVAYCQCTCLSVDWWYAYLEDKVLLKLLCLLLVLLANLGVGEGVQVESEGTNLATQLLTGRGPAGSVDGVAGLEIVTHCSTVHKFVHCT